MIRDFKTSEESFSKNISWEIKYNNCELIETVYISGNTNMKKMKSNYTAKGHILRKGMGRSGYSTVPSAKG